MTERLTTPINYVGRVGECSVLPTGPVKEGTIQHMSKQALEGNKRFNNLNPIIQQTVVQALTILGAYTISSCQDRWNRARWAEEWNKLNEEAGKIIDLGLTHTTEANLTTGYKTLFQMLEVGVVKKQHLNEKKKLSKERDSTTGNSRHTRTHIRSDWTPR